MRGGRKKGILDCWNIAILIVAFLGSISLVQATVYEAEEATFSGASVKDYEEASNGKILRPRGSNMTVTWTVKHRGGNTQLQFNVRSKSRDGSMDVYINNKKAGTINTKSRSLEIVSLKAKLASGSNTIELREKKGSNSLSVDYLNVMEPTGFIFQAEEMKLSGLTVIKNSAAEGGKYIKTSSKGTAKQTFTGKDGVYSISVHYLDKKGVKSSYRVRVGKTVVDQWNSAGSQSAAATRQISGISLKSGSIIEIDAKANGAVDQIVITKMKLIEAESLTLEGFGIESISSASGKKVIKLKGVSGSAKAVLTNTQTGTYDISTSYFDESDGEAVYKIFINNMLVDAWTANRKRGSANPSSSNRVVHVTKNIPIKKGQTLEFLAYKNNGESCCLDAFSLNASADSSPASTWSEDGGIVSLMLNGEELIQAASSSSKKKKKSKGRKTPKAKSAAELRVFNGSDKVNSYKMIDAKQTNSVIEVLDDDEGIAKMIFRVDEYKHHLAFRLIALEKIPMYDKSLSVRVTLPIGGVKVVALDDWAEATVSSSSVQLDWTRLWERNRFPGGAFAIYKNGNSAAVSEIKQIHQ